MLELILNSMVEEIIFGNILRIYGTLDNHLPTHGSSVYDFNQIHEILFGLEAADKLGVIWGAERENRVNLTACTIFGYYGKYAKASFSNVNMCCFS